MELPDEFDVDAANEELCNLGKEELYFDNSQFIDINPGEELSLFEDFFKEQGFDLPGRQLRFARQQFEQYKELGEKALAQIPDEALFWIPPGADSNSIAVIVQHLWGNMRSRWTDFLHSDGEKEWRNRDSEFVPHIKTRAALLDLWELGWDYLFNALNELNPNQWSNTVYIRSQPHEVWQAVNRQIAHYAYHIGQIVLLSKMHSQNWQSLSIPKKKD